MVVSVVVIGAGVVGLSTAVNIQELVPDVSVTIVADRFYESTASYGTGALFIPSFAQGMPHNNLKLLKRWVKDSWKFYYTLASSGESVNNGAMFISGYDLMDKLIPEDPLYKDVVLNCEEMSNTEKHTLGFHDYKYGFKVTTIALQMSKYLLWLQNRFEKNGGIIIHQHVKSFHELTGQYNIIVNCSGHGSSTLASDSKTIPVGGHLVKMKAPWIKHFILTTRNAYIIPGEDKVNLGVYNKSNSTDLTACSQHTRDIIEQCEKLCPYIKGAKFDHNWIGIRPFRETLRLEIETIPSGDRHVPVIHNYGHGYQGIGLSWGTAIHTAQLLHQYISNNKSKL
ncbi:hypothetical protein ACF0H5_004915 [Mactra antiquata]